MLRLLAVLSAAALLRPSRPAEILVLLPLPGYSHTMPFMPLFKELGRRGHRLTMVTPFPEDPAPEGFTQVNVQLDLGPLMEKVFEASGAGKDRLRVAKGPLFQLAGLWPICHYLQPAILEEVKLRLPPTGKRFDLIFTEPFFCSEGLLAASYLYKAPVVATMPTPVSPTAASVVGSPLSMSYVPNGRLPYTNEMNLFQRTWNTIVTLVEVIGNKLVYIPYQDQQMRQILDRPDLPYLGDLMDNITLLLTATHFSINHPQPYHRHVVEVAGMNLEAVKPLPKDVEEAMNSSPNGVIFFSLGSHFEVGEPEKYLQALLRTFSRLKQLVLVKWKQDSAPQDVPANVLIRKWFPQPAVLGHKKTVLFISHGGLNSIYEAAYYGVPVVGTAAFGDQHHNMKQLEKYGMGLAIDLDDIFDDDKMFSSINKVLTDPSFKESAVRRSRMLRDRPLPVLDEAVYWVEYVLQYGGAQLRPPALPWYSLALLDVALLLALLFSLPFLLLYACLRICFKRKTLEPNSKTPTKRKNKAKLS